MVIDRKSATVIDRRYSLGGGGQAVVDFGPSAVRLAFVKGGGFVGG